MCYRCAHLQCTIRRCRGQTNTSSGATGRGITTTRIPDYPHPSSQRGGCGQYSCHRNDTKLSLSGSYRSCTMLPPAIQVLRTVSLCPIWGGTRDSSPLDSSLGFGDRFLGTIVTYSYEVLNSVYHPLIFS